MPISQSYWVASGIFLCCLSVLLFPSQTQECDAPRIDGFRVLLVPQQRAWGRVSCLLDHYKGSSGVAIRNGRPASAANTTEPPNVDSSTASLLCDWLDYHRLLAHTINKHYGPYRYHTLTPEQRPWTRKHKSLASNGRPSRFGRTLKRCQKIKLLSHCGKSLPSTSIPVLPGISLYNINRGSSAFIKLTDSIETLNGPE